MANSTKPPNELVSSFYSRKRCFCIGRADEHHEDHNTGREDELLIKALRLILASTNETLLR